MPDIERYLQLYTPLGFHFLRKTNVMTHWCRFSFLDPRGTNLPWTYSSQDLGVSISSSFQAVTHHTNSICDPAIVAFVAARLVSVFIIRCKHILSAKILLAAVSDMYASRVSIFSSRQYKANIQLHAMTQMNCAKASIIFFAICMPLQCK